MRALIHFRVSTMHTVGKDNLHIYVHGNAVPGCSARQHTIRADETGSHWSAGSVKAPMQLIQGSWTLPVSVLQCHLSTMSLASQH